MSCYFTGFEYLLYSKKNNLSVMKKFREKILNIGFRLSSQKEDISKHYIEDFFSKDDKMLELHQKIGYNTKINSEGCISIYSGIELLENPYIVPETMNIKKQYFQYVWFPGEYYYFMITLPGDIEKDVFSKTIFCMLKELLY